MANLVSPGYDRNALISQVLAPTEERIVEFKGLNRNTVVDEGEMCDMRNLTSDAYPVLKPRKPRGRMELPSGVKRPLQIIRRFDKLGVIALNNSGNGVSFYYDGTKITEVNDLSVDSRAVAINNIMCFFPEKKCIDITVNGVQSGTYRPLDASHTLSGKTVTLSNTDASFTLAKGHNLKTDDAVNIHITSYTPSGGSATSTSFDISCIIEDIKVGSGSTADTIVLPKETFIEMTGEGVTSFTISGMLTRTMPEHLDYIVEWNNRLWGCSNADNTIYASKLGDPSNWQYYQGTSLDSYYAQQGSDERWTGIAEYSGHLLFFKPNSITRVYGTAPSNFQITCTKAYGIEDGSSRSAAVINDSIIYKSSMGFMAYQGGDPYCISDKLPWKMKNVAACTDGRKYIASCIIAEPNTDEEGALLVFDTEKVMWHREDGFRFSDSCRIGDQIYCATTTANVLYCGDSVYCSPNLLVGTEIVDGEVDIINPSAILQTHAEAVAIDPSDPPENYEDMEWRAVFGPFDEYIEEHKIYSKLALRVVAKGKSSIKVYIQINDGPEWEQVTSISDVSTKGDFIPIIPRRCDRYSVKIEGKGNCEIKSLTRRVRKGSFGRL